MKMLWDKYVNTLKRKMIVGISGIVFLTTLIVALIFLTQYRNVSLAQSEKELTLKAMELTQLKNMDDHFLGPRVEAKDEFMGALRHMGNAEIWILNENGDITSRSKGMPLQGNIIEKNKKLMTKLKKDVVIDYNYITYNKHKTLSVIAPIIENEKIVGAVLIHQDVNTIYNTYHSLIFLVIIALLIAMALSIFLGVLLSKYLTGPIEKLTLVTKEIKNRNYDVKTNINSNDEIGKLASTIDQMSSDIKVNINEIKELEKLAKELVANVSHEFKTPLTIIRGTALNLQDHTVKATKKEYDKIINNTLVLERLVNELLDLNAYQNNNVVLVKEKMSLKQLVYDVVSDMEELTKEKNINLKVSVKNDKVIEADYTKLRQLLVIFIDNAIKYSKEKDTIDIKLVNESIIIKDNGVGISEIQLAKIFERYYKVKANAKGYGLGLYIAKHIADLHGFKINIESAENVGTTVTIDFK